MERRTIDELVTRYEFEPSLTDVLVEGPGDKAFIEWVARELGLNNVMAYEVSTVEVSDTDVAAVGLERNNRGRVRYVARELEGRSTQDLYRRVAGLIDGDLDYFEEAVPDERLIIVTDFTAVEIYLFNERAIGKLIRLVFGCTTVEPMSIMDAVYPLLRELFLVRTAAKRLQIELPMIEFSRLCSVSKKAFVFNHDEYAARFVRRDGYGEKYAQFIREIGELRERPVVDRRLVVHGHDFIAVLRWYCKDVLRLNSVPRDDDLARAIRGCLEIRDFDDTRLAAELRSRFAA